MASNRWWDYVSDALDGMSALEAGRKAGFDSSAFTRWKKGASPDVSFVVKFARAFDLNVLEALVAAEIITGEEAGTREVRVGAKRAVQEASADTLGDEVVRRLRLVSETADVVEGRFGSRYDLPQTAVALDRGVSWADEGAASEEQP